MHRIARIMFVSLLAAAPPLAGAAPARRVADAPKAKPHKPVSAEHKKALAELYGGFKLGMTKDEVIGEFSKQLDEHYNEEINATSDITTQDRLRRDKRNEVNRLAASYVSFDSAKPTPWDVSIVEDEFAHRTGEAMLERWENQDGKNQRRFFFFFEGKLWKMFVSLDVSILPEDKKTFATVQAVMEGKYGPGEVDRGTITWRTPEFEVRAVDKLKSYDALGLAIEDPAVRKRLEAVRVAKAPPKNTGNAVIRAVIDVDHNDHPDVKANSNAVDAVIRAQGGTPQKPR